MNPSSSLSILPSLLFKMRLSMWEDVVAWHPLVQAPPSLPVCWIHARMLRGLSFAAWQVLLFYLYYGDFGAMALMLAWIAWRLVLEREWLSHQLCRAADNTTQTSCGSGCRPASSLNHQAYRKR